MMDNAYNSNTIIDANQKTYPTIDRDSRLCCSGYIINLVVKAILYGERLTDFSRKIVGCCDDNFFVP